MMAGLGPNKQFTCDIPDCRQCFLSEDHLSPYLCRHDGDSKSNLLPVDQTPTPNTIFRKCAESGLFQALQVDNPFEETFRKATEGIRSGDNPLDKLPMHPHADEFLNTPQVIIPNPDRGHLNDNDLPNKINLGSEPPCLSLEPSPPSIVRREADTSDEKTDNHETLRTLTDVSNNVSLANAVIVNAANNQSSKQTAENADPARSVQVLLRMPDGKLVQLSTLPVEPVPESGKAVHQNIPIIKVDAPPPEPNENETYPTQQTNSISLAKQKLKQALMSNTCPAATSTVQSQSPSKGTRFHSTPSLQSSEQLHQQQSQQQAPTFVPTIFQKEIKLPINVEDEAEQRRRKFLERNRAAAMRCRKKKKTWVQDLEKSANETNRINQQLEKDNAFLRSEIAHLKTLLLAHKDCPVTKALARGETTLPNFIPALQTASTNVQLGQPVKPVLVLNDPRGKRRRHTSLGSEPSPTFSSSASQEKDDFSKPNPPNFMKAVNVIPTILGAASTSASPVPVILSNFITTTSGTLTPVSKQAFILPKSYNCVNASPMMPCPPLAKPWESGGSLQNSSILPSNVIKRNPNLADRDVEIIGVKTKNDLQL